MPLRAAILGPLAALVMLLAPTAAGAATLTPSATCFTESSPIGLAGAGFTPAAPVALQGDQIAATAQADGAGAFAATVAAPLLGIAEPGQQTVTISAVDQATQAVVSVPVQIAKMTFDTTGGLKAPSARRIWRFSGFLQSPGRAIYGHFRHRGRTYADYRFGVPKAPCGTLRVRAPGIPSKTIPTGKWTVQVDFHKKYDKRTQPAVISGTTVFRTLK